MSLKHYQQFKEVLASYQMSERAKAALQDLKLVLMVAPTSTGRNTVIKELLKSGKYYFIVSDTTREPQIRDGQLEQSGGPYFFRSEEEVLADLKAGEFLEAAIIHELQVSGISIRELEKAKAQGKIGITDIEIVGTDNVVRAMPSAVALFLVPPNFEEWQRRIKERGGMTQEEVDNRLISADKEFQAALSKDYYKFVLSDTVAQTIADVEEIIAGGIDKDKQTKARALAEQIHAQLKELNKNSN